MKLSNDINHMVIIWGGTGHCRVLSELLECQGKEISAIVDNRLISSPLPNIPILHGLTGLETWSLRHNGFSELSFALAIGGDRGRDRLELLDTLKSKGMTPMTLVHHSAYCARNVQIGEASQILARATICSHVRVGAASIVNTSASVDHDVIIGNGVHIGPGACLAGEIVIEDLAFIGTGAVVLPRITIGKGAIVGAGAVVTKNVPAGQIVVGNPARRHRRRMLNG